MPKKKKYRRAVQDHIDYDYKHKLNQEDLDFLNQFTEEFYHNKLAGPDSLHRERLSEEKFDQIKEENFESNNSRNRDSFPRSEALEYDDQIITEYEQEDPSSLEYQLKIKELSVLLQDLISEALEEVEASITRENKIHALQILMKKTLRAIKLNTGIQRRYNAQTKSRNRRV